MRMAYMEALVVDLVEITQILTFCYGRWICYKPKRSRCLFGISPLAPNTVNLTRWLGKTRRFVLQAMRVPGPIKLGSHTISADK